MIARVAAQTRVELLLTLRRGESLLVTIGIPVGALAFFGTVDILPHGEERAVDFLVPGTLALAVVAMGMVSLGIATGFERQWGILKRLGATPLGREGLLAAKTLSVLAVVALQALLIGVVGYALGWRPSGNLPAAAGMLGAGVIAFSALGFALAGLLRAEATLAVANALFLAFLLLGGILVPVESLPAVLGTLAQALPAEPLATGLRAALTHGTVPGDAAAALALWTGGAVLLASRTFRWE